MRTCKHRNTRLSDPRCYSGSVATHPYTDENPFAHGGVRYVEICAECGAERAVNANGLDREYSTWGWSTDDVD